MHRLFHKLIATTAIATAVASATAFTRHVHRTLVDISGKWTLVAAAPDGAYEATATFKQDLETLTGTINSQALGSAKLAGSVKGDTVKFSFSIAVRGNAMELRVGGVIKDKDNISGQLEAQSGMGTFPFSARRVP